MAHALETESPPREALAVVGSALDTPLLAPLERRRAHRIELKDRVEFKHGGKLGVSFLGEISLVGMLLRRPADIPVGEDIEFILHLRRAQAPLRIVGHVVPNAATNPEVVGMAVEFRESQAEAEAQLRDYLEREIVSKLRKICAGSNPSARNIIDLASLCADLGAAEEAHDLFERAVAAHRHSVTLHEGYARMVMRTMGESFATMRPALDKLEQIATVGLKTGGSALLGSVIAHVAEQRALALRRGEEHQRRREESLLAERVEFAVEARLAEMKAERNMAVADLTDRLTRAQREIDDLREQVRRSPDELASEREAITREREQLTEAAASLRVGELCVADHLTWAVDLETREIRAQRDRDVRELRERVEHRAATYEESERRVQHLRRELEAALAALNYERTTLSLFKKDITARADQIAAAQMDQEQRQDQLAQEAARLDALHDAVKRVREQQRSELAELQDARTRHDEESSLLIKQRAEQERVFAEREGRLSSWSTELQQRDSVLIAMQQRLDAQQASLQQRAARQTEQEAELTSEKTRLESLAERLSVKQTELEGQAHALQARDEALEQAERAAAARAEALDAQRADLEERETSLVQLSEALDAKSNDIAARTRELADQLLDVETRSRRNAERSEELDRRSAEVNTLSETMQQRCDEEVAQRGAELEASYAARAEELSRGLADQRQALTKQLSEVAAENERLEVAAQSMTEREHELASTVAAVQQRAAELGQLEERLQKQADALQAREQSLREQTDESETTRQDLDAARSRQAEQEASLAARQQELAQRDDQLQELHQRLRAQDEAQELRKHEIAAAGETLDARQEEVSRAEAALEEQTRELHEQRSETQKWADEVSARRAELDELEAAVTAKKQRVEQREAEATRRLEELTDLSATLLQREAEIGPAQQRNQELSEKLERELAAVEATKKELAEAVQSYQDITQA